MNYDFHLCVLFLIVKIIFGSDVTIKKNVFFPDESGENTDEFDYLGDVKLPNTARETDTSIPNRNQNLRFRIDSTDVPCTVHSSMSFCEEVENQAYPTKYVESILANADAQTFENYFNKTSTNETLKIRLLSTDEEPVELCETFQRTIYPQLAMNVQRDWHFVINQPNYRQQIRVEICQKKKSKCLFNESFPNSYVSSCVQRYTKVPLLSLGANGSVVSYDYEFPSFCQCKLHSKKRGNNHGAGRRRY